LKPLRIAAAASLTAAVPCLAAQPALAHAADRGFVLLLPTGHYIVGGACAVAASFLVLLLVPGWWLQRLAAWRLPLVDVPSRLRIWTSLASFLLLAALVAAGFLGSRDPLSNPLPLTVWTLLWVGLTLVQGLVGNLWRWIDPWYGPVRLVAAMLPQGLGPLPWPRTLGYWPGLAMFAGFVWFELIDAAPDDPARLAMVTAGYWSVTFVFMLVFGHPAWSRRGEFLSVFFRMVSRFAIFAAERGGRVGRAELALCAPGAKAATAQPLPLSGTLFLLFALSSVSFDGLSNTFFWLGLTGFNPLEHPGRTAMQSVNTVGLLAAFIALSAVFFACVWLGARLAGSRHWVGPAGLLAWSIVPIALAYHFAHYLTALAVDGQYALVALSDPIDRGWNLFGTATMQVQAGIAMGSDAAWWLWNLQAGAIVAGHVLAVLVAHVQSWRLHPDPGRASLSQVPLTVLMVGYTVLGLWLLSTPTAA
jgi:hypothetical protein